MDKKPEMTYAEYVHNQTVVHGQIEKPEKYAIGERRAIDWFFKDVSKGNFILDLGCGTGNGIIHLNSLGYEHVWGMDINQEKVSVCIDRGLSRVACKDIMEGCKFLLNGGLYVNIVWSSHSFEHLLSPEEVFEVMQDFEGLEFIFLVLPYPDKGDPKAHIGSFEIGTRIDDGGETAMKWFDDRGWETIEHKFDDFRESEIWLKLGRKR